MILHSGLKYGHTFCVYYSIDFDKIINTARWHAAPNDDKASSVF